MSPGMYITSTTIYFIIARGHKAERRHDISGSTVAHSPFTIDKNGEQIGSVPHFVVL